MTRSKRNLIITIIALVAVIGLAAGGYSLLKSRVSPDSGSTDTSDAAAAASDPVASSDSGDMSGSGTSSSSSASGTATSTFSAPDFTVVDEQGNDLTLSSLSGKVIVVNFWATWCPYCVQEMGDYQTLYEQYGDRVAFVMVDATDGRHETIDAAKNFKSRNGYTFPIYFDTETSAQKSYGIYSYPTTIVIDSQGTIVSQRPGVISLSSMRKTLDGLLG